MDDGKEPDEIDGKGLACSQLTNLDFFEKRHT